ncbi:hypothetical protein [Acinetobacter calcoaceticus]|uniref:hypothetical protein n=1 Tax=Acinetobacter calcoaceticus TaxID=471 RepID=UPI00300AD4F4
MSLDQLFRREFFIRVLITFGFIRLKTLTGFTQEHIENLAMGISEISNNEMECIFKALAGGA